MHKFQQEIKRELLEHIVPFWESLKDEEYGGFYGEVSHDLDVDYKADKSSLSLSRYLYAFSRLYNSGLNKEALKYADHAYQMLINCFYDQTYGGVYFLSDHKGKIKIDYKHTYVQGFFIYGLSEYYLATGNEEVLSLAITVFNLIEAHMFDPLRYAYNEEFYCDFTLKDNELTSEHGVHATFTTNTHLHLLEAYTNLYKCTKSAKIKNALLKISHIFENKIVDDKSYQVFFDHRFVANFESISYGHDIETTWLIDEMNKTIGRDYQQYFKQNLLKIVDETASKINDDGSQILEVINHRVNTDRIWWVQAEAMVGYFNAYQHTKEKRYLDLSKGCWDYIQKHIVDKRIGSEWLYQCNDQNLADLMPIASIWKTPYHNMRACIEILERINDI